MAAPFGEGPIDVALTGKDLDARGYVDLTVAAMTAFGARVAQVDHTTWRVEPTGYTATDFVIEPDASAATYLWAAEALTNGKHRSRRADGRLHAARRQGRRRSSACSPTCPP